MSEIIDILMKRDGVTREEARNTLQETREMINDAIASGNFDEVEDIVYSELGLEMDYIDELIM